ncbi:unnamed protein product [Chrysodeixis includens]|uniref:Uncharacterized protein n=1 Tax=Chrysodeixis includens TaxID=689277 RepID=A0A9P0BN66_CHRIL|nr:unnamed protein product [Chrysodeixis includens]
MNKLFIVLLAVCLVSVNAFVKRDAPAGGATEQNYLEKIQKDLKGFSDQLGAQVQKAFDPETLKKGFEDVVKKAGEFSDQVKNAFDNNKPAKAA